MITRRGAMIGGSATLLAAAAPAVAAGTLFGTGGHPLGLQLYMLAAQFARDPEATLRAVADIGYREVETNFDVHSPEKIKAALDRTGLRCTAIGVLPTAMRGGSLSLASEPAVLAAAVRHVGARYLTSTLFMLPDGAQLRPLKGEDVPAMFARIIKLMTAEHWKRTAAYLNKTGAALKQHGVRLAHHNHSAEFAPLGETNGLAILLEHTDPTLVDFEMDVGWVVAAGRDPVALLRAYPGRFRLMHVKDISPANIPNTAMEAITTEVGAGIIDWPRVLHAAMASGVRHFAVEQEPPYAMPEIEAARKSFLYLSGLRI